MVMTAATELTARQLERYGLLGSQEQRPEVIQRLAALELSELDLMTIRDLLAAANLEKESDLIQILGLLFACLGQGSVCLHLDADAQEEVSLYDRFLVNVEAGRYEGLIGKAGQEAWRPLVIDINGDRRRLYFQRFHHHEQRLKKRLELFFQAAPGERAAVDTDALIDGLYDDGAVIRIIPDKTPIVRDSYQVQAIAAALKMPLLIVSGGPGTGKTSLLVNLLRALVRTGTDPDRVLLAAPTGRAAQRMGEALRANLATISRPDDMDRTLADLQGSTLHKLLVYRRRSNDFLHGARRPLDADLIVVDEVSMVDVIMMDRLFTAIDPKRTRVVLMGDKDQLPSVEAGAVLADLNPASGGRFADRFVVLHNTYRSAGRLRALATSINKGETIPLQPLSFAQSLSMEAGNWAFVDEAAAPLEPLLEHWVAEHYMDENRGQGAGYKKLAVDIAQMGDNGPSRQAMVEKIEALLDHARRCRILTLLRRGPRGAQGINRQVARLLAPHLDPQAKGEDRLFHGALIMVTRNDYSRELFNGDVGVVLFDADMGGYQGWFQRRDRLMAVPAASLPDWQLAFAMTVHKSQGSEFDDTWLILPQDVHHRMLTREMVYTAATRASQRLIVYGSPQAFQTALEKRIQRHSGLVG